MSTRACTICGKVKSWTTEFFAPDKRRNGGTQSHCRECERSNKKAHSDEMRQRIAYYKVRVGCSECGYKEHAAALEFDHVRGKKRFCIANMTRHTWPKILAEIKKCEVRCSNCHRIKTWHQVQIDKVAG